MNKKRLYNVQLSNPQGSAAPAIMPSGNISVLAADSENEPAIVVAIKSALASAASGATVVSVCLSGSVDLEA